MSGATIPADAGSTAKGRGLLARLAGLARPIISLPDNPVFMRQALIHLGGGRLGVSLLFVNAALLISTLIVVGVGTEGGWDWVSGSQGQFGLILYSINSCVTYGLLAILLPMRVAGLFESARIDHSFDLVVTSGVRPARLHFGNWAQGVAYAALLLSTTLPYHAFARACGGVAWSEIARGFLILWLYSSVILVVAQAIGVAMSEFISWLFAALLFLAMGGLSFAPLPAAVAHWTPIRRLSQLGFVEPIPDPIFTMLYGTPTLFGVAFPEPVAMAATWGAAALAAVVYLLLGPAHRFVPGLNNFGNVVLEGDRKRSRFRTMRLHLNRRVEMAFFYQNRPRRWDPWDWLLRAAMALGLPVLWWTISIGSALSIVGTRPLAGYAIEGFQVTVLAFGGVGLAVGLLFCCETRDQVTLRERVGPLMVPRWMLSLGFFSVLIGLYLGFAHWPLVHALDAQAGLTTLSFQERMTLWNEARIALNRTLILVVAGLTLYLVSRLTSRLVRTAFASRSLLVLAILGVVFAPMFLILFLEEGLLRSRMVASVVYVSPLMALLDSFGDAPRRMQELFFPGQRARLFYLIHIGIQVGLVGIFGLVFLFSRRKPKAASPSTAALLALLALLLFGGAALRAADEAPRGPLRVEAAHGFRGAVFSDVHHFTVVIERAEGSASARDALDPVEWQLVDHDGRVFHRGEPVVVAPGAKASVRCAVQDRELDLAVGNPARVVLRTAGTTFPFEVPAAASHENRQETTILLVNAEGREPALTPSGQLWHPCRAEHLPEVAVAYSGLDRVLIGPTDLSAWTARQRRALFDWTRLGGTVVFYGAIDERSLAAAGEWAEVLKPAEAPSVIDAGFSLRVHPLAPRQEPWVATLGGEDVAILSLRKLGAGFVGYLAVDPLDQAATDRLGKEKFWERLASHAPASLGRWLLPLNASVRSLSTGGGALLWVSGYFLAYGLVSGVGLILFFRTRRRRGWVWVAAPAVSLAFLFGTPLLFRAMQTDPSAAMQVDFVFHGERGGSDTRLSYVALSSSGRQHHAMELEGETITVLDLAPVAGQRYVYQPAISVPRSVEPLGILDGSGLLRLDDVSTAPWGRRLLLSVEQIEHVTTGVRGKLVYDAQAKQWSAVVSGLRGGTRAGVVVAGDVSRNNRFSPSAGYEEIGSWLRPDGREVKGIFSGTGYPQWWSEGLAHFALQDRPASRPRAFLVWMTPSVATCPRSSDIRFEKPGEYWTFHLREMEVVVTDAELKVIEAAAQNGGQ